MKISKKLKLAGLFAFAVGAGTGCAGAPATQQDGAPGAEQVASDQQAAARRAIDDAKAAQARAEAAGAAWRDTADLIAQAEQALANGDTGKAIELANMARRQAENAITQKQREDRRVGNGVQADSYTVMRGDNLWTISAKGSVYGNPFHWPLIYRANRDKISDPDLIYPGQQFAIDRNASEQAMLDAAHHARTRGAWRIGVSEDSDRAYLRSAR